jgi:ABC-type branched-subunit amino acid transport system substrate-binding protein
MQKAVGPPKIAALRIQTSLFIMRSFLMAVCALVCAFLCAMPARAEPGVTPSKIVLGQSAAFSGPAAQLGRDMNAGAMAYFKTVNDNGGVYGRRIELVTRDDGYEAARAEQNTRALIEQDGVFALFGYVGTPTSNAAVPVFTAAEVPFFAPFTGSNSLREPFNRNIFNLRASYFDETERLVQHLVTLGIERIAVFHQNDAYGQAGLEGVKRAMDRRKLKLAATAQVERNSSDVSAATQALLEAKPEAVIQISAYTSCAALIKSLRARGYGGQFLNVSFVGTTALSNLLGTQGQGVIVSQVVPSPWGSMTTLQREYAAAMKRAGADELSFGSMEGYLAAKVFVEGLRRAGDNPTRKKLVAALESMNDYDAGGFKVSFGPNHHAASSYVNVTMIGRDNKMVY